MLLSKETGRTQQSGFARRQRNASGSAAFFFVAERRACIAAAPLPVEILIFMASASMFEFFMVKYEETTHNKQKNIGKIGQPSSKNPKHPKMQLQTRSMFFP